MSRIGKKIIEIPTGVTVKTEGHTVTVKGTKGELNFDIRPEIDVVIEGNILKVVIKRETKNSNAFWGLSRALIANAIQGVSEGFEKKLELVGVGYRVKPTDKGISLSLGFSHTVEFPAPASIKFTVPDQQNITITGPDKQLVGLTAAQIRKLRKPEPYKGKGIKYFGEVVRRKAGKSGKA